MTRRLFLFAAYDANNIVDPSLIYYVSALSKLGDVVLIADSDIPNTELQKLEPYVLYSAATRHGEYDFGSYRRAYTYARDAAILDKYDFVYLVNDSVYGPTHNLLPLLKKMESDTNDAFGLVKKPHREHPHIQSWFIGMRPSVFTETWFDEFMMSITRQESKGQITRLYEQGFTKRVTEHNLTWDCLYTIAGRGVYNKVKKMYKMGVPFIKKVAFTRHGGALGHQINYVLTHLPADARAAITAGASASFGKQYICWLLTKNPARIIFRNIKHAMRKLFIEGI